MDSPAILLTKPYQPVPTYGTKYEKPNTALFQNPGVIVDGQFPYYEVTPPTEQMWQDEAYNDVKRQIADASARYLNGNPRDIFFREDPVVKHLLQEDDKVRELLDKQREESNLLKQEKQIKALIALGFIANEAIAAVKAKNQADAVKQVFEGKGQEETVDDAINEVYMTPALPESPPPQKTPLRRKPKVAAENEAVPMDLTESYKSPVIPQQQAVPMDLTEPYKSPKKGEELALVVSPAKPRRALTRADLDTADAEALNQALVETLPITGSSVMAGAGAPDLPITEDDVVSGGDARGRPVSVNTLEKEKGLYEATIRKYLYQRKSLRDLSGYSLNELKRLAVGLGVSPAVAANFTPEKRSTLEYIIKDKYVKVWF